MNWSHGTVRVRVPATSANLGPGFDALGLALGLHDTVEARVTDSGLSIAVTGEGRQTAGHGEDHLVVRAMRAAFEAMGGHPPGIGVRCDNTIPHRRGLGSSAAAICSGLLAARALAQDGQALLSDASLLARAVELEGHPDNVAACLAGGLTIAWHGPAAVRMTRLPVLEQVSAVVCVPPGQLSTRAARRALPEVVPHADAAADAGRAALLVAALTTDPRWLFDATEDYLHQRYRAPVMPGTADLVDRLRRAGAPAVVSGAGPSVLVFTGVGGSAGPAAIGSIAAETGIAWRVTPLDVDRRGALVQLPQPEVRTPDSARQGLPWSQVQGLSAGCAGWSP